MKRYFQPIAGKRVHLRLLEESDLEMTRNWRNQNHIRKCFFDSRIISSEAQKAWFESYRKRDDDFTFIIETTRPIGQCALYNIEWEKKRAEYGRLMIGDPDAVGMKFAREAAKLLTDFALNDLGLEEVYLRLFAANLPALAIYKGCGFTVCAWEGDRLTMIKRRDHAHAAHSTQPDKA